MKKNDNITIWQDVVSIKELILSVVISVSLTMGLYFLVPSNDNSVKLLFGLLGSIIGFIISTILYNPKRKVEKI